MFDFWKKKWVFLGMVDNERTIVEGGNGNE
jgi:hypothetical protein